MKNTSVYDNSYNGFFVEHLKFRSDTPLMKSRHYHDFFEIYYYLGDSMHYFVDNQDYELVKNDFLLIDKFSFHRTKYNFNSENERVLIEFHDDVFNWITDKSIAERIFNLFHTINLIRIEDNAQKAMIHSIMLNLVDNFHSATHNGPYLAKLNLLELCLHMADITEHQKTRHTENATPLKKPESKVVDIIKYVNENYNAKITLDDLVDRFYVNKYYLCHVFKNETGLSIIDFVNSKRLAEAEKLLRYSDESVTDICYKVGFSSINHFLKLFKSTYDLTPKKFRADVRSKANT
ncbi:MAG: AraC family transcriptional regulator [Clostridiaceae bacterium]